MRDALTGQGCDCAYTSQFFVDLELSLAVMWESGEWDCGLDELEARLLDCQNSPE